MYIRSVYIEVHEMKAVVRKWGNSAAVRIPAPVLKASELSLDEAVNVREEGGCIVIEPLSQKKYDLGKLLDGITRENVHDEIEFGLPKGKEVW